VLSHRNLLRWGVAKKQISSVVRRGGGGGGGEPAVNYFPFRGTLYGTVTPEEEDGQGRGQMDGGARGRSVVWNKKTRRMFW
jgi:hypothetical protein